MTNTKQTLIALVLLLGACGEVDANQESSAMKENYLAILNAFNTGQLDVIDDLVRPDAIEHAADPKLTTNRGPTPLKETIRAVRTAFPDLKVVPEQIVVEGDLLMARVRMTGTNRGPWEGGPATNKAFDIDSVDIVRYQAGRVVEHWEVMDRLTMLQQLGLLPPAGG
jgi:predicted ester cyclase